MTKGNSTEPQAPDKPLQALQAFLSIAIDKNQDDYLQQLAQLSVTVQQMTRISGQMQAQLQMLEVFNGCSPEEIDAVIQDFRARKLVEQSLREPQELTSQQKQAVKQFAGWEKVDGAGHKLPAHVARYAAVIDQKTQLMWAINPHKSADFPNPPKAMTWQEAQVWLKQVNQRGWCGHKDWRLPTVEELKSLLLPEKRQDLFIRQDVFADIPTGLYGVWSSSSYADYGNYAWFVNFNSSNVGGNYKTYSYYVRVVRSGQ